MTALTPAALMALGEKATAGEWTPDANPGDVKSPAGDIAVGLYAGMRSISVRGTEATLAQITRAESEANAAFIASACNFIRSPEFATLVADAEAMAECRREFAYLLDRQGFGSYEDRARWTVLARAASARSPQ